MTEAYTLHVAKPEDLAAIAHFVNTNFFLDVPVIRMFGIDTVPPTLALDDIPDANTYVIKATSASGELIGAAINKTKDEEWHITEDTDPNTAQFIKFMHYIEADSKLKSLPKKTVELFILSVAPHWRRKGVAQRLGEESILQARRLGLQMMKICCANVFTAKLAKKLGFKEFYRLPYREYERVAGGTVSLRYQPPHDNIYFYVKDLRE